MRRIAGIDLARALAVLGMVTAHVGPGDPEGPLPWSLLQIADGRSSALFVVLSGVSIALMSGGAHPVDGIRRVQVRTRILTRAFVLLAVGVVLATLNVPIVIILPTYALLFAVAACLLRTPASTLLIAAGLVTLIAPPVRLLLQGRISAYWNGGGIVDLVLGQYYPALVWIAYLLTGLAVTRADLSLPRTRRALLIGGAAATVLGYGSAAVLTRVLPVQNTVSGLLTVEQFVTSEPHSSSTPEVLGNIGAALFTLAVCLWAAERWPRAVAPLTATGALALTVYIGHILVVWQLGSQVVWEPTAGGWLTFLIVIVAACWAWQTWIGRGPAERALHRIAERASDISPDHLPEVTARSAADSI